MLRGWSQNKCTCWQHCVSNDAICPAISSVVLENFRQLVQCSLSLEVCALENDRALKWRLFVSEVPWLMTINARTSKLKYYLWKLLTEAQFHAGLNAFVREGWAKRTTWSQDNPERRLMTKVWNMCSKSWSKNAEWHVKKLHIVLEFREHLPTTFWLNACTNIELPPGGPHGKVVRELLDRYSWEVLLHPSYSPDMSPPDFDLFPKLKINMHGVHFSTLEDLSSSVTRRVRQLNCSTDLTGIMDLPKRWDSVIWQKGDYTEGL